MAPTAEGEGFPASAGEGDRDAWVRKMRLQFCHQPEFPETAAMVHADGTLNAEYFKTRIAHQKERKWTEHERQLLLRGIEEHGIGHFNDIATGALADWTPNELRLKTIRLIGRQNLALYKGWKGDADTVAAEYERNKEIGLRLGCWKGGVLVYDDAGAVERELLKDHPPPTDEETRGAKRARTE